MPYMVVFVVQALDKASHILHRVGFLHRLCLTAKCHCHFWIRRKQPRQRKMPPYEGIEDGSLYHTSSPGTVDTHSRLRR